MSGSFGLGFFCLGCYAVHTRHALRIRPNYITNIYIKSKFFSVLRHTKHPYWFRPWAHWCITLGVARTGGGVTGARGGGAGEHWTDALDSPRVRARLSARRESRWRQCARRKACIRELGIDLGWGLGIG